MEDRHSLSAPRYIGDLQWEVDVFRDTVEQPVETLLINSETLPPRTRKGKVVWQLPSDANKLPSFGAEDKRRIFDLFKQVKKQRKKEKAAAAKQQSCGNNKSNVDAQSPSLAPINEPSSSSSSSSATTAKNPEVVPVAKPYAVATTANAANDSKSTTPSKSKKKGKSKSPTPKKKGESSEKQKMKIAAETIVSAEKSSGNASQADAATNALNSSLQDQMTLSAEERLIPEVSLDKKEETQTPLKQQHQQSQCTTPSTDQRAAIDPNNNNAPSVAAQPPPVRFQRAFVTNPAEVGSLSVSAAKQFVDRYYTSVQEGISLELACHYTEKAQKSVSVGNAHSVVTGYESIALQLASFRGATFTMRGVVAQDTPDGGAHLLVTGVMIPAEGAGLPSSFAHSVVLTPAFVEPGGDIALAIQINGGGKPFQIHNDAFALISPELPIAQPRPPPPTNAPFASPVQSSPAFTRPPGFN